MRENRAILLTFAVGVLTLNAVTLSTAQVYPSRPITIVVPFPAGGPTDTLARILAEHMRSSLGQPLIIENVAGASGSIGVGRVARAAPDGYTVGIGHWATHVVNGATYELSYDLFNDLEPISLIANSPQWIVARKSLPANNLKELITWLKAMPGEASAGAVGGAGAGQLAGLLFQKSTGTRFHFVPYRGGAEEVQDLVAGRIDFEIDLAASSLMQVRSGLIKAYAVMAKSRWFAAPDVPTTDEAGVAGVYASFWHGLWAPKATPKDTIAKLNAAVVDALADATVRQRFTDIGQEIFPPKQQTPDALRALQKSEIEKWWPIIKAAGIKAE